MDKFRGFTKLAIAIVCPLTVAGLIFFFNACIENNCLFGEVGVNQQIECLYVYQLIVYFHLAKFSKKKITRFPPFLIKTACWRFNYCFPSLNAPRFTQIFDGWFLLPQRPAIQFQAIFEEDGFA